jgi:hypothetical protein
MEFKTYLESEEKDDVKRTLEKIPKKHSELVKDYKIIFQPGNCLKGDDSHIGLIDEKNKTITIASPWNYGREYTLLHEVGHAVWKFVMKDSDKKEWKRLLSKERRSGKGHLKQDDEEIFCMTYAQHYAKNKLKKFDHESLVNFISNI